ncbi:hypothetical protein DY000_02034215 [Brassica cretica]|uniref:Uncharacterized protein n=1 Tax=Brassica cretica TaxID=69181 RepID=A0ABQ7DWE3_BRACR|nr:hypothetical protein DY000_02034215 [Brassica cretica]
MKQLTPVMAPLVISSSPPHLRPPSPPSHLRPPPDPPPCTPPPVPLEALSPPKPPDPHDASFGPVFLLLFDTSFDPAQALSRTSDLESLLLNLVFVTGDGVVSLVSIGDKVFASKCFKSIYPSLLFIMLVTVLVASTTGCTIPITTSCSMPHPLIHVLSRFSNLIMGDELIFMGWYLGFSRVKSLSLAFTLVRLFTVVCSPKFVVFKSFWVQVWQFVGLMPYITTHPVNRVLLDVYCPLSSSMEFVSLCLSSTLCCCVAGSSMLKIRDTSNAEVLIKGFIAMLRIVNCALVAVSISGFISLIVVSISQGFISLSNLMFDEIRGLLYDISCLSVLYAPILICCICFFVIACYLAMMALLSCCMNTLSICRE